VCMCLHMYMYKNISLDFY